MPLRVTLVFVLLVMAFVTGRVTAPGRETIREAEAAPVPSALPGNVTTFHDASNEVTCWRAVQSGPQFSTQVSISCLPDQWLASARAEADTQ
jgi:hypothetical protein